MTFATSLARLYAFAPDEQGYLYTFNHVYTLPINTGAQSGSGWITAPTIFIWITYLPAKILNLLGVPDYLSIRMLSILLITITLYLFLEIQRSSRSKSKLFKNVIFLAFCFPSVFLWTSTGIRESFIIAEIAAFLVGLNLLIKGIDKKGVVFLFIASYGLVSTKIYLWACLMVALIICAVILFIQRIERRLVIKLIAASFLLPTIAFASTTSAYALDFIFHGGITEASGRSGDSITQVEVEIPATATGTGTATGTATGTGPTKQLVTFHGDYTLIALHFYLIDSPNSFFSEGLGILNLDKRIQEIWDEKVGSGLVSQDNQVGKDTSSLNGHILEPGKIGDPLSMLWAAFVFLCGPFPFIGDLGIAVGIASLESPLWWALYLIVIFQFIRFRKVKALKDPATVFTLIFLFGEILFSALIEVNLGTSFRHRSILLVPLVFLYVRLAQRSKELTDLESGII